MKKKVKAWAMVGKKDGYEHKKGDLLGIGLSKRTLQMRSFPAYEKIIPCVVTYEV